MKMGHRCCSKQKVKRGLWSPEEDEKLVDFVTSNGHSSWSSVPKLAGLQRCGKSCRLRWINYLRPDLKRGSFTDEEERTIIEVHRILGNRWAQIAKHLPGRTDNEVKNFWNSCIKKKLLAQGFDPNTHNLLPPRKQSTSANNSNNIHCSPKEADQVFTVNTIRTNKKDTSSPNMEMISSYIQSNTESINLQPSSTIGWSFSKEQSSSEACLDGCRFGLMDEASMLIDQQQMVPAEEVLTMQLEKISAAMEEADELQALKRSERLDDDLPPFSNNGGSGFEFGFGDYDTIMESGMYGDVVTAMDELSWDIVD